MKKQKHSLVIFFDLDGTLYSYETGHQQGLKRAHKYWERITNQDYNTFKKQYEQVKKAIKRYLPDTAASHSRSLYFQTMIEQNFKKTQAKHIAELTHKYWEGFIENIKPFPNVEQTLRQLTIQGHRLAIITNMSADIQFKKLHALNIDQYFEAVITSEEVGHEKPHPHIYLHALNKMKATPENTIMIGDNYEHDIEPAEFMGIKAFLINIEGNQSFQDMQKIRTEHIINSFEQLLLKIRVIKKTQDQPNEGMIKYQLQHNHKQVLTPQQITDINQVREKLWELKLIGIYPENHPKTPGVGYGNVSKRYTLDGQFIITGTQTGHLKHLTTKHYAIVTDYNIEQNTIYSKGQTRPSSEALTHAAIYEIAPNIKWVIHVHHRMLWEHAQNLNLPTTPPNAEYGTPQLARAIQNTYNEIPETTKPVVLLGHEEGILSWGENKEIALQKILDALKKIK